MPTFITDLAAAVTPFLGVIVSGAGTVWATKNVIVDEYRRTQAQMHLERSMSKETPQKAIESIIRIIDREHTNHSFVATVGLAEFATKLAGALADGGTATTAAVGLAASLAKLANILRNIVRDVEEKNAANKAMSKTLTLSIFETCPIVGAYYVCAVPHSVLVNSMLQHIGRHGFNDEVERVLSHHIEPLREQARRLIREHRFVIVSLMNAPGVMAQNENNLEAMANRVGKSNMVGMDAAGYAAADAAEWESVVTRKRS